MIGESKDLYNNTESKMYESEETYNLILKILKLFLSDKI